MPPQSGPVDEVDALFRRPSTSQPERPAQQRSPSPATGAKGKKWQPLTSVAPAPAVEGDVEDDDPFAVGDSEGEGAEGRKGGKEEKERDLRGEDSERLKRMASEKGKEEEGGGKKKVLGESERSGSVGTRDKAAEEILRGKS